jgi:hypothetical protein
MTQERMTVLIQVKCEGLSRDRTEYFREWHMKHKAKRNAAARERYHTNPTPNMQRKARARSNMTDAERKAIRAKDRAYRAKRKTKDREYRERNRERIRQLAREAYIKRKARRKKRDPIAAARRLYRRADQIAHQGYAGVLNA